MVGSKPGHRPPPYLPGGCLRNSWWRRLFPRELSGVFLKVITLFFLMSQSQCLYSHGFSSFPNFDRCKDAHGCISGVKIFALRSAGNGEARHKSVFSHCCRSDPCEVPSFLWSFWKWKAGAGWLLSSAAGNSCIAVASAMHICCQALFHLTGEGLRDTDKGAPGTGSDPEPLHQPC